MNQYNWPVIVVVVQLEYVRLPVVVYINYVSVCVLVCLSTGYVLLHSRFLPLVRASLLVEDGGYASLLSSAYLLLVPLLNYKHFFF